MKWGERLESSIRGSKTKVSASKALKLNKIGAAAHFQDPAAWGGGGRERYATGAYHLHLFLLIVSWGSLAGFAGGPAASKSTQT